MSQGVTGDRVLFVTLKYTNRIDREQTVLVEILILLPPKVVLWFNKGDILGPLSNFLRICYG